MVGWIGAVDHHPSAWSKPGEYVGRSKQGGVENEDMMWVANVLANERIVGALGDPGERHHRGAAPLDAVVGIALNVASGEECRLGEGLRGDHCALTPAAVNPQFDHVGTPDSGWTVPALFERGVPSVRVSLAEQATCGMIDARNRRISATMVPCSRRDTSKPGMK